MALHDLPSKIAEITRNLPESDRETLRKIFEGVSAELFQNVAASTAGIPDGPTERHKLLKSNFLKQVPGRCSLARVKFFSRKNVS